MPSGLLVVHTDSTRLDDFFSELNQKNYTLTICYKEFNNITTNPAGYIFIILQENYIDTFRNILALMCGGRYFNSRVNYLLYLNSDQNLEEYFILLHEVNIYNVHIIVNDTHVEMVRNPNNCEDFQMIETEIEMRVWEPNNLNMYQCPLNVLTRDWEPYMVGQTFFDNETGLTDFEDGIEYRIIKAIAEKLNLTINFYTQPDSIPSYFHDMLYDNPDKYDIVTLSVIPTIPNHKRLDYTLTYVSDSMVWFCPTSLLIPKWAVFFYIFSSNLWLFILLTLIFLTILLYVLKYGFRSHNFRHRIIYCLLEIIQFHLMIAPTITSETKSMTWFILTCAIYGIIIACAYQSGIVSILTSPNAELLIRSLEQIIVGKVFKFAWLISTRRFLIEPDWKFQYLLKNTEVCNSVPTGLKRTLQDGDTCMMTNRLRGNYLIPLIDADEEILFLYIR